MGERKAPTPPPADQGKPDPPLAPPARQLVGHLQDVHVVHHTGKLEGELRMAPGAIQVAHELGQRMMLRNAVGLLDRIVRSRVLAHGGPDGLELDAVRIVRWYRDLPEDQRDMTLQVGVDWADGPDCHVTREVAELEHKVRRLEAAPLGQAYLVDERRKAAEVERGEP